MNFTGKADQEVYYGILNVLVKRIVVLNVIGTVRASLNMEMVIIVMLVHVVHQDLVHVKKYALPLKNVMSILIVQAVNVILLHVLVLVVNLILIVLENAVGQVGP
jgi:hypothetical protein